MSTFMVGGAMGFLAGVFGVIFRFIWALVFGALISSTDPVAVISLFKTAKAADALQAKTVGESLLNDGIGGAAFTVVVAIALAGGEPVGGASTLEIIELFATEAVGGAALGLFARSPRDLQAVASTQRSAQAEKAQDKQDDNHKADKIYDAVHDRSSRSKNGPSPQAASRPMQRRRYRYVHHIAIPVALTSVNSRATKFG